jgi:HMG (high mobility group) box
MPKADEKLDGASESSQFHDRREAGDNAEGKRRADIENRGSHDDGVELEDDNEAAAAAADDVDEEQIDPPHANEEQSPERREYKKRRDSSGAERKAPGAPKRFKSSYICFFMAKQTEIKEELGEKATVMMVSKRSAEKWKSLSAVERAHWDEVAAQDKERYLAEKSTYTGPWKVPWKRARKDPSAPKRPMSAFLMFAQGRRAELRTKNPDLKNTEVSQILGEMWRNLSEEDRRPFVEREKADREVYKVKSAEWKEESEARAESERRAAQAEHPMYMAHVDPSMHGIAHPYGHPPYPHAPPYPCT